MRCPYCGKTDDKVLETRVHKLGESIRRRRECLSCHERFSTLETLTLDLPNVIKKDGRIEPFNKEKVLHGIKAACYKRPVGKNQIETAAENIYKWAMNAQQRELPASAVGAQVLKELKSLDDVAFVRFASVHQTYNNLNEFLEKLDKQGVKL